jgi:hypothetical protein
MTEPRPLPARRRFSPTFYILLGLVAAACIGVFLYREGEDARKQAAEAKRIVEGLEKSRGTFYRLDPKSELAFSPTGPEFHGWKVLGEQPLPEAEVRDLCDLLASGSTYSRDNIRCFEPGMGFRLQSDSRTLDLIVCLNCQKFLTHQGSEIRSWNLSKSGCARFETIHKAHVP